MMRLFKYLMGLWTAVAVYALFSFLSGPKGLAAYNQLLSERDRQWANMRTLGSLNEDLEKSKNGLLYDRETLSVYARRLGYGREDERFIRIVGLGSAQNPYTSAGQIHFAADSDFFSDRSIKITALCAGLAVFAFFFVLELLGEREQ